MGSIAAVWDWLVHVPFVGFVVFGLLALGVVALVILPFRE